ncbi:MAG: isocyanide synthase family protein [Alphaproteobacteria bacterium]|nr:isocyanide synthase family protein [Alphaproteobacteria bacterium]
MTTVSLRPNYALKKVMKKSVYALAYTVLSLGTALAVDAEHVFQDMPGGVKGYLRVLPIINREDTIDIHAKAKAVAALLRKMRGPEYNDNDNKMGITGEEALALRIECMMKKGAPLLFVPLGYPYKSTNTEKKVLSPDVDMGELMGLLTLNHICYEIGKVYAPGANVRIYSDGYLCKNVLNMSDETIQNYHSGLNKLAQMFNGHIEIIDIMKVKEIENALQSRPPEPINAAEIEKIKKKIDDMTVFMKEELDCTLREVPLREEAKIRADITLAKELETKQDNLKTAKTEGRKKRIERAISKFPSQEHKDTTIQGEFNALRHQRGKEMAEKAAQCAHVLGVASTGDLVGIDHIRLSMTAYTDMSSKCTMPIIYGVHGTPWHQTPMISDHTVTLKKRSESGTITTEKYTVNGVNLEYVKQ